MKLSGYKTSPKSLYNRSLFNATIGFIIAFASPVAGLLILGTGIITSVLSKIASNRLKERNKKWFLAFTINLTLFLGVLSYKADTNAKHRVKPYWVEAVSKTNYYVGSLPFIRQLNFSFDSLTTAEEEVKNYDMTTTDSIAAPPDAPPGE